MTGRERIIEVLKGNLPDRVPFSPNIGQWFEYHNKHGSLPEALIDCRDETEVMIKMGCDVFGRLGLAHKTVAQNVETETKQVGNITTTNIITPHGELTSVSEYLPEQETTFERKYLWTDFKKEYESIKYLIAHTDYIFDDQVFNEQYQRIGDNGVWCVPIECCPLKRLHILAGQVQSTYFLMDYEKEIIELMEIYAEKIIRLANQSVQRETMVLISCDNLDSLFYPPNFIERYCQSYFSRIAEIIHARGKYFFDHACGRLNGIKEKIRSLQLDGCEAVTHPPVGDITLKEAREIHPGFVVTGGMTPVEQGKFNNNRVLINTYVKKLFEEMEPLNRFIFSTACNTSIRTSYETLCYFRDACWKYGTN